MALTSRYYLFEAESARPKSMSLRLVEGLIRGTEVLQQYAGTRQKVLAVYVDHEDGRPQSISDHLHGSYFHFDAEGGIRDGIDDSLSDLAQFLDFGTRPAGKVVALKPSLDRKRFEAKHRWTPTEAEMKPIIADIWPREKSDRLEMLVASPKPPKLTYDARHALEEGSKGFWGIGHEIGQLAEPSLRGFAYEARRRGGDSHPELYEALAVMAEKRLAILAARKKKTGVWFAWVSMIRWDESHVGEEVAFFHVKCQGRPAAEKAAAQLLREHADKVAFNVSVEAGVESELEWIHEHAGWNDAVS